MPLQFSGSTQTGTTDTDYLIGVNDGPAHTMNGGAGNDILIGDYGNIFALQTGNTTMANAANIDQANLWYTNNNPLFTDSAIPHTTVHSVGENAPEYFAVTIGDGETLTVDVDFANYDTVITVFDEAGIEVAYMDDGAAPDGTFDPENNPFETYLTYLNNTGSTQVFVIQLTNLTGANGGDVSTTNEALLNISVTGHAATGLNTDFDNGNDTMNGGDGNDQLYGFGGDDTINGGADNDIIDGGAGNDTMDGGTGIDTLSYDSATAGVTVQFLITAQQNTGGGGLDTISNFENLIGSDHDDILGGDQDANIIRGGNGNDLLSGFNGADQLFGGEGNDTFSHTVGAQIEAGDFYDGGNGANGLSFSSQLTGQVYDVTLAALSNIQNLIFRHEFGHGADVNINADQISFDGIFVEAHSGSNFTLTINMEDQTSLDLSATTISGAGFNEAGDSLTIQGDADDETITGSSAADTINGDAGDDIIEGGDGDDILDGGADTDTLSYENATAGVTVDLSDTAQQDTVGAGMDTISNFENLTGSAEDDMLTGTSGANIINGGDGDDTIDGRQGQDTLNGGAGNDTFIYTFLDSQTFNGGDGNDTVEAINRAFNSSNTIDLAAGFATFSGSNFEAFISIENYDSSSNSNSNEGVIGTFGANIITMGGGTNTIFGGYGNDTLDGGDGDDTLSYEGDNRDLVIDLGAETMSADETRIDVTDSVTTQAVFDAAAAGNIYFNVHSSTFPGGELRGQVNGIMRDDRDGDGFGQVIMEVGPLSGANEVPPNMSEAAGEAYLVFNFLADGSITYTTQVHIAGIAVGDVTAAHLHQAAAGANGGVVENLIGDGSLFANTETDSVMNFENVLGGAGNDIITGNAAANQLDGFGGDDTLIGGALNDVLNGGDGNDTLDGGTQNDILNGGLGADDMTGGSGNDTYFVDDAGDSITELGTAGSGYDIVNTTLNVFFLTIGDNLERVNFQGTGNFVTRGNELDNRFTGAAGNDRFVLDSGGADIFSGGTGRDAFDARSSTTGITIRLDDQSLHGGDAAGDTFASIESFFGSLTAGDFMQTGAARARFSGFGGDDTLVGGASVDFLQGGADNDTLFGNAARDTLQGGTGNDIMRGGDDRDQFLFVEADFGQDQILDWDEDLDYLKIFSTVATSINDFTITGNGTTTVVLTLNSDPNNTITLSSDDGSIITLDAGDFLFF